jgi:hypothetical protein
MCPVEGRFTWTMRIERKRVLWADVTGHNSFWQKISLEILLLGVVCKVEAGQFEKTDIVEGFGFRGAVLRDVLRAQFPLALTG